MATLEHNGEVIECEVIEVTAEMLLEQAREDCDPKLVALLTNLVNEKAARLGKGRVH